MFCGSIDGRLVGLCTCPCAHVGVCQVTLIMGACCMMSGGVRESLLSGLECEKHATIVLDHARVRMWVIHGVLHYNTTHVVTHVVTHVSLSNWGVTNYSLLMTSPRAITHVSNSDFRGAKAIHKSRAADTCKYKRNARMTTTESAHEVYTSITRTRLHAH